MYNEIKSIKEPTEEDCYLGIIRAYQREVDNLQQENKQLKEQINEYQKAVDETTSEKIDLQEENKQLKELYRKTCEHLFNIGNDELARYFQAQINECPTFTTQILGDKE